ncbi:hypothetical protein C7999DRAFT_17117 [Corynascus novoguineensis]|uniref:Uncharacterized protein n=1 Tax=Corynascus novoguineensis TaxID=1126955 RepID=A0AAN7CM69_9PEZI|nr:hypothetical protein C7999DRAFT_17117 [Corynascus novoguineensis]
MSERSTSRSSETESRQTRNLVSDVATQTEEEDAPEQHTKSIAKVPSLDRNGQLAQQKPARGGQVLRSHDATVAPQQQYDRGGALAVRLDMDLDVEVNMQAKFKGKLELSIL